MRLRPPDPFATEEEYLETLNLDLEGKSRSELEFEKFRAAWVAERWPTRHINLSWQGTNQYVTVRQWADDRITTIDQILEQRRAVAAQGQT